MRCRNALSKLALALAAARNTLAIKLDISDPNSIKAAASTISHSMMQWYVGNQTGQIPGLLPAPYYWWEAGAVMGSLIDYWYYTGDSTYNQVLTQALQFQASPSRNFMPENQTQTEGNDDQAFWAFACMTAAEYRFPNPAADKPQWLELAQGVWNSQQLRWDRDDCNGGLRWQIFTWNNGYDYKNSPSNSGFINLGARLATYTGNATYAEWATKAWDWMEGIGLIGNNQGTYRIYDGTYITNNCSTIADMVQWSYSAGMLFNAAAVMHNFTGEQIWLDRADGIWRDSSIFFKNQVAREVACEGGGNCNTDQLSFKAYFLRFLASSTKWVPQYDAIFRPYFEASAQAAAAQCTGTVAGLFGNACGTVWTDGGTWDSSYGFGQQMTALQAVQSLLIDQSAHPVTAANGGISKGDPAAGTQGDFAQLEDDPSYSPITTASRAGAGILTGVFVLGWLGTIWWMYV